MAVGLPIVAFDSPINREFLGNIGIYACSGDAKSFAEKIIETLYNSEVELNLGNKLRQRAKKYFDWNSIVTTMTYSYSMLSKSS